jgi:hypothetical protein
MKKTLTAIVAGLALAVAALLSTGAASNDVNRFSAIYVYKYLTASKVVARDSLVAKYVNGYQDTTFAVLDSAKTGYAAIVTDTLRLSCGSKVSGYFKAGITGTGSGTAMTVGTLPAACRPRNTVLVPIQFTDADTLRLGFISWASSGIGTLQRTNTVGTPSATLIAGGTRAIPAGTSFTFSRF